jgi:hypothetical protein
MGDIGGVVAIFEIVFAFLATRFGALRMSALITNRLYHLTFPQEGESRDAIETINTDSTAGKLVEDEQTFNIKT